MSQAQFAGKLGISRDYVSQLENGREPGPQVQKMVELYETAGINSVGTEDEVSLSEDAGPLLTAQEVKEMTSYVGENPEEACRHHLEEYLKAARSNPSAAVHALIQLELHLPISQARQLAANGRERARKKYGQSQVQGESEG